MQTLTDEDSAAVSALLMDFPLGAVGPMAPIHAAYVAGLRAGMERAAKICEETSKEQDGRDRSDEYSLDDAYTDGCIDCADTIRAAIQTAE